MDDLVSPEEDPENMPSATEELLQIMEDFADVIDKFMFEIVTFLAVVDSGMGLIKDVLGLFGFEGWKMAFFPTFSFIVTTGVFLFGAKKRKGKRDSDVPEGLADAFEAMEDVMEVVEDVAEELEDMDAEGGPGDSELGDVLEDVVGSNVNLPIGEIGELQGTGDGERQEDANISNAPVNSNQNISRKVTAVAVFAAGIIARLKKKKNEGQQEDIQSTEAMGAGARTSKDLEKHDSVIELDTPLGIAQQNEWQSGKTPAFAGDSTLPVDNRKPLASIACGGNESVIIDLNVADHGKKFVDSNWQNAAKSSVISTERQLRWNSRQLAGGVEKGAFQVKHEIERASLPETRISIEDSSPDLSPFDEEKQTSEYQLNKNPIEMASGVVKNSSNLAGSATKTVDQTTRRGVEETRKKSGSMLHIAIRLVRLVVRVVSKKKGGSSSASQNSENSIEKVSSTDVKGSTESVDSDSVYFDCVSHQPPRNTLKQSQSFMPMYTQYKYLITTSTQTDRDNTQPIHRSEPQYLNHDSAGLYAQMPRNSPLDTLRRSVLSMPDTSLMEMRDAAIEEIGYRGKPSANVNVVTDPITLKPAWLGSRDEMAGRLLKETRRDGSPHLDGSVIVHRPRDEEAHNGARAKASLHEPGKGVSGPDGSLEREQPNVDGESCTIPERSARSPPPVWNRGKGQRERYLGRCSAPVSLREREGGHSVPNPAASQNLDSETFEKPEISGYGTADVWGRQGRRETRPGSHRSSSSYEGLEDDYGERNQRDPKSKANSLKQPDMNDYQCSVSHRPHNLPRLVSYEDPKEGSVFEEDSGLHQDGDWSSEKSSSKSRLSLNPNQGKYTKSLPLPKFRHSSRLTSFQEDDAEDPYFPRRNGTRSSVPVLAYQISESSGSVESSRTQRRSNISLSSVRFADEENERDRHGRGSRNSNRQKNGGDYLPQQSLKHNGQQDSRRKIASDTRWNSAICLTGHQKAKMSVSSRGAYKKDDYCMEDETGSLSYRQGSRARLNRGASFNRLNRGPSTISRTQSASYLGDDESDVGA